jgi:hypothetical protein
MARHTRAVRKSVSQTSPVAPVLLRLRRSKGAVSPAISTVVLTGAIVTMLVATIPFAKNFLDARTAEYEFSAMKESMQTVALQLDDVAWTIGRTQTIHYTSKFGWASFRPLVLNYAVYVDNKGLGYSYLANYSTGILMFNMATSRLSLGNNYFERLFPLDNLFLLDGVSAPISHVYAIEKLPMNDGSFVRVVVVPSIRTLNSTITTPDGQSNYYKFYLPILVSGNSPGPTQSVKLVGSTISLKMENAVRKVKVQISFPQNSTGFNQAFFNFASLEQEVDVTDGSIIEFYTMSIAVSLGVD